MRAAPLLDRVLQQVVWEQLAAGQRQVGLGAGGAPGAATLGVHPAGQDVSGSGF